MLWEYSGNTLGILWEYSGDTLGILWEYRENTGIVYGENMGILYEYYVNIVVTPWPGHCGNALGTAWEQYRNTLGVI